jgi:hypothetical protein
MTIASKATFDEARWPVVVVTLPEAPLQGQSFEDYLVAVSAYYERGRSFGFVFDVRRAPPLTAAQRNTIAEYIERSRKRHPELRVVMSVVIASAIQRGLVRAITWLTPQPVPTEISSTVDEGVRWVMRELAGTSGRAGALSSGP